MVDFILRQMNANEVKDHDFYGEDATSGNAVKTIAVVTAMREAAADYTCELCGAASLLKTCLACLKQPDIDHRGRDQWNKWVGVDA